MYLSQTYSHYSSCATSKYLSVFKSSWHFLLILYLPRHGTSGHDRSSKLMFSQAITMAEELGIHKRSREKPRNGAEERHQEVCGVVSWGLILLSKYVLSL